MHIGDMLLQSGLITKQQLDEALEYQKSLGGHLGHIMVKLGFVKEDKLISALSEQLQIPTFELEGFEPDPELMQAVPQELVTRLNCVPLKREMGTLVLGVSDPTDFAGLDELRLHAGGNVETLLVAPSKAMDCLNRFYHTDDAAQPEDGRGARKGRKRLSSLVQELERESAMKDGMVSPDAKLEDLTTRQIAMGLAAALEQKGVLKAEDIVAAAHQMQKKA